VITRTEVGYPEVMLIGLCEYEQFAIMTGRVPTISTVCRKHRWVEALLVAAFALHLHRWVQMEDQIRRRVPHRGREGERNGHQRLRGPP
jgi:hypothetical protein